MALTARVAGADTDDVPLGWAHPAKEGRAPDGSTPAGVRARTLPGGVAPAGACATILLALLAPGGVHTHVFLLAGVRHRSLAGSAAAPGTLHIAIVRRAWVSGALRMMLKCPELSRSLVTCPHRLPNDTTLKPAVGALSVISGVLGPTGTHARGEIGSEAGVLGLKMSWGVLRV